jgi:dTDP-glucose pyrophosphorylase
MIENDLHLNNWSKAVMPIESTIQDIVRNLDDSGLKISLIVDAENVLQGTISDGDIRRGLLKGLGLGSSIENIIFRHPLVAPHLMTREMVLKLMLANKIQQIPIVDECRRVIGLYLWDIITTRVSRDNLMIVMAGGRGERLRPYTENRPKPLVPMAGKPMLEHILERAIRDGFSRFIIAVNYLGEMIETHFGNGSKLGVQISYLREQFPLGTAGALSLMDPIPNKPFIVTNGDVITDISYGDFLDFHERNKAAGSMAVRLHEWQNPYGVVQMSGVNIIGFEEKPIIKSHINAGVYVLDPLILEYLVRDERCDMPTLFDRAQLNGEKTIAYPMHEPWLDIGRPEDLLNANLTSP